MKTSKKVHKVILDDCKMRLTKKADTIKTSNERVERGILFMWVRESKKANPQSTVSQIKSFKLFTHPRYFLNLTHRPAPDSCWKEIAANRVLSKRPIVALAGISLYWVYPLDFV